MDTMISVDARRAAIETNLEVCKRSIALSMWQIGTLLNAAKDEGLVPHGEWTAWATAHSGLNERGVQLAMRQARELGEGSPLLMLDDSKINALIRIPAEEREAFAEAIDAEHASSRDVARAVADYRRRLDAARTERDEALRLVGAQKEALSKAREERETTMREAVMAAIRQEREEAEQRQAQAVREAEEAASKQADERIAFPPGEVGVESHADDVGGHGASGGEPARQFGRGFGLGDGDGHEMPGPEVGEGSDGPGGFGAGGLLMEADEDVGDGVGDAEHGEHGAAPDADGGEEAEADAHGDDGGGGAPLVPGEKLRQKCG